MARSAKSVGPASLLKVGTSWLDAKAIFVTKDGKLADAALMLWKVTKQLRARQGEMRLSNTALSYLADVRRQTVADILMGVVWPDTRTLGRICASLKLEITTMDRD